MGTVVVRPQDFKKTMDDLHHFDFYVSEVFTNDEGMFSIVCEKRDDVKISHRVDEEGNFIDYSEPAPPREKSSTDLRLLFDNIESKYGHLLGYFYLFEGGELSKASYSELSSLCDSIITDIKHIEYSFFDVFRRTDQDVSTK